MQLFINDIPIKLCNLNKFKETQTFDLTITKKGRISAMELSGNVLFPKASNTQVSELLQLIEQNPFNQLRSVTLVSTDYVSLTNHVRGMYKIIRAAGGLVRKDDKVLMIYRLKKWDLPKGKIEKSENARRAAIREVEEECNVKVRLDWKIGATWHTYTLKDKRVLKKTNWYAMSLEKGSKISPQVEEDIEEVRWMNGKGVYHALESTYRSIQYVFERYYQKLPSKDHKGEKY